MMSVYQQNKEKNAEQPQQEQQLLEGDGAGTEKQLQQLRTQLNAIAQEIRKASNSQELLKVATEKVLATLACDRALIYSFESSNKGTVIAEAKTPGWTPALNETLPATIFGLDKQEDYAEEAGVAIDNTQEANLTPYQKQLLDRFQVKAYISLPLIIGNEVWGLLVVQQCQENREWNALEESLLEQLSVRLTQDLQLFEFRQELQQQDAREKAVAKVIDKVRRSLDQEAIFKTLTQEVRNLTEADRVGVYKFHPDWSGEFIYESVGGNWTRLVGPGIKTVWEDTYLQETKGGRYRYHESFAVDNIYTVGHSQCHVDILEQFEVRAYVIVPIFVGDQLWGLLGVYQNSEPRHWTESEIDELNRIAAQLWEALLQADTLQEVKEKSEQLAKKADQERTLTKVINRIRQSLDLENIFKITAQEVRSLIQADRVAVFRFNPDWTGVFVSESVAPGWVSLVDKQYEINRLQESIRDCQTVQKVIRGNNVAREAPTRQMLLDDVMKETQGGQQLPSDTFVRDDIYKAGFNPCYLEVLEQYEAKAYAIVSIYKGNQLWGMLAAYQNSGPRHWQETEVNLLQQVATQLGVALQQAEYLQQIEGKSQQLAAAAERERTLSKVIDRIRKTTDINTIFRTTTQEVRNLINVDRVAVYKFRPDFFGDFIAESEAPGEPKLAGPNRLTAWEDPYLNEHQGGRFRENEVLVVDDVYNGGLTDCHVEALEMFHVKACVVVAIFRGDKLWGLLSAFQNKQTRHWEQYEVDLLRQVAAQIGVALQQAYNIDQLKAQSEQLAAAAERERTLTKVIDRIRKSFDLNTIFRTTTQEVRSLIDVDRVAIYKFRPDYFGDFIAESEAPGEPKLVGPDRLTAWEDPYLNENEGGRFQDNEVLVVDDVYNGGLTDCHVEALEMFHVKACIVVAIFKGDELWGLLSAFQNKRTRHWEQYEVDLLRQVATQIGVAIQQTQYLQEVQNKSTQLLESAEREKQAKELLQQRAAQLLMAVRPALEGDLTVRAPVTEDEVGTIADAYNNTLQSLRKIIIQVQDAAQKVSETSRQSDASVGELTSLAQQQYQDISQALKQIEGMVASTNAVGDNAKLVEDAVQKANQTVESGDTAMNRTVEGIQEIRETVAQTAKKIKSLSESSQKISKAVSLISNFATQTNVLALNAAIEATRAGEYGKGFAVVAEEVRSLSRQSADATQEIEKLVEEIQAGTAEVAATMETGIQQVVEGTTLVNETRQSLNEIVSSTTQISQLVEKITQATQLQTQQSEMVTQVMTEVADVANKTSDESVSMSVSFNELLQMAQELLNSTGKFKVNK